jgi:hypothetical protein
MLATLLFGNLMTIVSSITPDRDETPHVIHARTQDGLVRQRDAGLRSTQNVSRRRYRVRIGGEWYGLPADAILDRPNKSRFCGSGITNLPNWYYQPTSTAKSRD